MTAINKVPFNRIPQSWAFDPEIGPFIRELMQLIWQSRERSGGDFDLIEDLELNLTTQDGGNRGYRVFRDTLDDLDGRVVELKRFSRSLEQQIYQLNDLVGQYKNLSRMTEQKINELTERLDSGT